MYVYIHTMTEKAANAVFYGLQALLFLKRNKGFTINMTCMHIYIYTHIQTLHFLYIKNMAEYIDIK